MQTSNTTGMHIGREAEVGRVVDAQSSVWWVILLLLVAAGVRFYNLSENSIWFDEAVSIKHARLPFWEMMEWVPYDDNPPLHHIMLFGSLRLFGVTEFAARLPSALFDVGTVGLVFLLARRLFGTLVGLIAACLVAFSPFHIIYAQEARMYAAFVFFATLSIFTLVGYLELNSLTSRLSYVAATTLLLYTHYYALFVVAAENFFVLYLLFRYRDGLGKRLIDWILIQVVVLALFGPWIPTLLSRTMKVQGGYWLEPPSLATLSNALELVAGNRTAIVLGLILLAGIWRTTPTVSEQPEFPASPAGRSFTLGYWDKMGLLLAWFALPFIVPFVLSQFIQPFFLSRYLIGVSPAWHIAVALGLRNWCNGRPVPAALGTLVIMAVIMPSTIKAYKPPWKPDWRDAVAYLDEHVPRQGQVLFPASWESQSYLYYTRRDDVRLLPSKEPAADILDDAQIWFISTDVCPTRLRRQSVQGCADSWKVRRAWDSASSAMPRQQSLCGDHADADPELGVLVETRRFYNVSVCRYHQELE